MLVAEGDGSWTKSAIACTRAQPGLSLQTATRRIDQLVGLAIAARHQNIAARRSGNRSIGACCAAGATHRATGIAHQRAPFNVTPPAGATSRPQTLPKPSRCRHRSARRRSCTNSPWPIDFYIATVFGNVCGRLVAPAGGVTLKGRAAGAAIPDCPMRWRRRTASADRPVARRRAAYLMPSRYCETDKLIDIAWSRCLQRQNLAGRGAGDRRFVHDRVTFGYEHAIHEVGA